MIINYFEKISRGEIDGEHRGGAFAPKKFFNPQVNLLVKERLETFETGDLIGARLEEIGDKTNGRKVNKTFVEDEMNAIKNKKLDSSC